jgi:hypothetical protein
MQKCELTTRNEKGCDKKGRIIELSCWIQFSNAIIENVAESKGKTIAECRKNPPSQLAPVSPNKSHLRMSNGRKKESRIPGKGHNEIYEIVIPVKNTTALTAVTGPHVPENRGAREWIHASPFSDMWTWMTFFACRICSSGMAIS